MKFRRNNIGLIALSLPAFLLFACSQETPDTKQDSNFVAVSSAAPKFDSTQVQRGRQLYLKNCTVCHGINGEGAPDWHQRNPDGTYPAPPLNGTGHAWHHPYSALVDTIKHGTIRLGGNMPPWKDRLSDQEINDIIIWFQSKWPKELYQAWQRMDRESRNGNP